MAGYDCLSTAAPGVKRRRTRRCDRTIPQSGQPRPSCRVGTLSGDATLQIAKLKIENFRGVREGTVQFSPHTVFVGANNCGKTTVVEALALLFGRDRMIRQL